MNEPTQWEYRVVSLGGGLRNPKDEELEAMLNELGEQGWEVVALSKRESSYKMTFIVKRPLTSSVRRQRTAPGSPW